MISVASSHFCCGLAEMGNFNYTGEKFTHYHRPNGNGSDTVVKAGKPTTREEILEKLKANTSRGGIICTTGVDQEYLNDILPTLGFVNIPFTNRTHYKTEVKLWFLDMNVFVNDILPREKKTA